MERDLAVRYISSYISNSGIHIEYEFIYYNFFLTKADRPIICTNGGRKILAAGLLASAAWKTFRIVKSR